MFQRLFEQVSEFIDQRLSPYDDQITELMERLEDMERRLRGVVKPGRVIEIHPDGQRIKVAFGENQSPWINWFSSSAGAVREYRCPSIGEQCVLLNYGGGDNSMQSWALTGMPSNEFPRPEQNTKNHVIDWGGGMRFVVNTETQEVTWDIPKKLTINTPKIISTAEVVTDGDQIAGGVSTIEHKHKGVVQGADVSEEPVK